jgi:hypothetical protein
LRAIADKGEWDDTPHNLFFLEVRRKPVLHHLFHVEIRTLIEKYRQSIEDADVAPASQIGLQPATSPSSFRLFAAAAER